MPTLNWIGKDEIVQHDKEVKFKLFKKVKGCSVGDKSKNLLIHGDNLEALKALMPYYQGQIKCIYIDPPYNTGNENWVYNDNVNSPKIKKWLKSKVNREDLTRHDKWLCMMYPRLKLLKELLSDEGVIFISINEDELYNLKHLCDEIFDETNYLTTFTVKVRHEDRILKGDKDFHEVVEYLLMYRKSLKYKPLKREIDNTSLSEYVYEVKELKSPKKIKLGSKEVELLREDEFKIKKIPPSEKALKKINIRGSIKEGNSSGRFYMAYLDKVRDNYKGCLIKVSGMGADRLGYRYFLMPSSEKKSNGDYFQGVPVDRPQSKEIPFPNYLDFESDFNRVGYEGGVDFRNGKKPIHFLMHLFDIAGARSDKEAIIVDSFAGSGSTAHAVMEFNKKYIGKRKFILIEMEDYAKTITAERIKKSIQLENYKEGFEFCELGKPLFDEKGDIEEECSFEQLATYIYFTETQTNIDKREIKGNFIGEFKPKNSEYYLIFKDKYTNVLKRNFIEKINKNNNKKVIYADLCLIDKDTLEKNNIQFKQIPYEVKKY